MQAKGLGKDYVPVPRARLAPALIPRLCGGIPWPSRVLSVVVGSPELLSATEAI